jgi:hypothetical protein
MIPNGNIGHKRVNFLDREFLLEIVTKITDCSVENTFFSMKRDIGGAAWRNADIDT